MIAPPVPRPPAPRLVIGNRRPATASGGEQEHIYADTGRATVRVPLAGAAQVDPAVAAARDALPAWWVVRGTKHARRLCALGDAILADAETLAAIETPMPFGGCKQSGFGRIGGRAAIREFTRVRNVWLSLESPQAPA